MKFIAVSEMVKKEAEPYLKKHVCKIIYNGVDLEKFHPHKRQCPEKLNIVSAAALEERKGMQYMIRALASYGRKKQITYDIYGSGSYQPYLNSLISDLGLEDIVELKGATASIEDVLPEYEVLCHFASGEAFGLSILEGMASGLAVLSADIPPYHEFVHRDFGWLIDRNDEQDIHKALDRLLDEGDTKFLMGEQARLASQKFSWALTADKYLEFFGTI